jgi:hypothetical protein
MSARPIPSHRPRSITVTIGLKDDGGIYAFSEDIAGLNFSGSKDRVLQDLDNSISELFAL